MGLGLPCLLAALPFALAAVRLVALHPSLGHRGDQALIAMRTEDAAHLTQMLGVYSRYGWTHPGPAWFYLMAGPFAAMRFSGTGLVVASLTVHAVMASLVVAAAYSARLPLRAPFCAIAVLGFVVALPALTFVQVWNPYAVLLPTALAFLLAARAATGLLPAGVAFAAVGGYLVQVHVGTALLVAALGAAVVAGLLVRASSRRPHTPLLRSGGRPGAVVTAVAAVATLAMWTPPLLQQFGAAPGHGNLGTLLGFFRDGGHGQEDGHPLGVAFAAVGRLLGISLLHREYGPFELDTRLDAATLGVLGLYTLTCLVLVAAARRARAGLARSLGVLGLVGAVAAVVSIERLVGPVMWFVAIWVTVLPLVLTIGYADLIATVLRRRRRRPDTTTGSPARSRPVLLAVVAVSLAATGVVAGNVSRVENSPGVRALADLADGRLPATESHSVLVEIGADWLEPAGLVRHLEGRGWTVHVNREYLFVFGDRYRSTGREDAELRLVPPGAAPRPGEQSFGTVPTESGPVSVFGRTVG